ncbi:MAG: AMP-binding protein, partial [Bacteroidota bacterium]
LDQVRQFGVTAEDRVLQFAALSFDASVSEIFMAFYAGAALVLIEQPIIQDALRFTEYLADKKVSVATLPPTYLSALPLAKLAGLHVLITAGEPAKVADLLECSQFARCFNAYGPTECAVCVTIYPVSQADQSNSVLPIGRPIANTKVYVLDASLQPVAIGVEGEIYVSGHGLARGYLHQPSLTSERFIENPFEPGERLYRTGDIGKWLPDGNLSFIGRKDNQVKIHGYRIELGEIENALSRHEKINDAVVMVREDEGKDKYLVAYYTNKEAESLSDLKTFLGQYLPNYMIPAYFVVQSSFPLTAHGKIDYQKLPNPVVAQERQAEYIAAQNSIQQRVVDIWEKVLSRQPIGIHDNFFELGGHSLKATQVLSLVQESFNIRLDLGAFFITPTIAALATIIEQNKQASGAELKPVPAQEYYDVSHAQRRLWVLHQLEEAQSAYNLPAAFMLEGVFDKEAFCKAFVALVNRHEILRTTFAVINGEPKQRIHPVETFGFEVVCSDLRAHEQPLAIAEKKIIDETTQQFDLENGPLIRAHLLQ